MNRSLLAQLSLVTKSKQFSRGRLILFRNLLLCLRPKEIRVSAVLLPPCHPADYKTVSKVEKVKLLIVFLSSSFTKQRTKYKQTKKYKSGFRLSGNITSFALFSLDLDFYPEFLLFCFCKTCFQCKIFRSVSFSKATSCIFNVNCH